MAFPSCDVNNSEIYQWIHISLLSLAAIIIIASLFSQFKENAPYGRHAMNNPASKNWGFPIPQRIGHIISDALPGIPFFLGVYLIYAGLEPTKPFSQVDGVNIVLVLGWILHFVYRGVIHPLIMPYSSKTVAVGITVAGIFPNCLFSYLIATQVACTKYPPRWSRDPRFVAGVILYCVGYLTNRWADLTLRSFRTKLRRKESAEALSPDAAKTDTPFLDLCSESIDRDGPSEGFGSARNVQAAVPKPSDLASRPAAVARGPCGGEANDVRTLGYVFPNKGLFRLVSCPNYLGELVEWTGFALACWSYPALGWALFGASTFLPRAIAHHRWYLEQFPEEMARHGKFRKALIPYIL